MYLRCDGQLSIDAAGAPLCDDWEFLTDQKLAEELTAWSDGSVLVQLYELLTQMFTTPAPEVLIASFMAGITIPLIAYLASYGYGVIINFFKGK